MTDQPQAMDEDWELLTSFFPEDWKHLAAEQDALKGLRKDKSAANLLRTLLLHIGCGHSLRETVLRARRAGLAEISDVALLKRLRKSGDWLHLLCRRLFEERLGLPEGTSPALPVYLLDASIVREPGQTGSQWRLHYSLLWPSLRCEFFALTPAEGAGTGESFRHFPVVPGGLYLADRGYSNPAGLRHLDGKGGRVTVRLNPDSVRLYAAREAGGGLFDLPSKLGRITKAGRITQWSVTVADAKGRPAASGRLCVLRKSEEAIRQAQEKLRRKASRNGTNLRPETLEYARFVIVFTTFEEESFPAEAVLEWYRVRWQVELVFKRFKGIAGIGHLPKHDPESSKAWLYGKLFVALLTEKLMAHARAFSPWGYDVGRAADPQRVA